MMIKKLSAIISVFVLHFAFVLPTHAQSINPCPRGNTGGGWGQLCNYDATTLASVIRNGITLLFIVATLAALFFLIFGGIKWITSGGDKANLEQARNMIIAAAVGLVITLASYFILNIVLDFFGLPGIREWQIPTL